MREGQFQHKADNLVSQLTVAGSITSGLALRWDVAWGNHSGAGQPAFTSNAYSRNGWLHRQSAMEPACGPAGIENGVPTVAAGTVSEPSRNNGDKRQYRTHGGHRDDAAATFFRLSDRLCAAIPDAGPIAATAVMAIGAMDSRVTVQGRPWD
jgi:hypothetical protein